jgi:hypothetical protein
VPIIAVFGLHAMNARGYGWRKPGEQEFWQDLAGQAGSK